MTHSYMWLESMGTYERQIYIVFEAIHIKIQDVFMETNKKNTLNVSKSLA